MSEDKFEYMPVHGVIGGKHFHMDRPIDNLDETLKLLCGKGVGGTLEEFATIVSLFNQINEDQAND